MEEPTRAGELWSVFTCTHTGDQGGHIIGLLLFIGIPDTLFSATHSRSSQLLYNFSPPILGISSEKENRVNPDVPHLNLSGKAWMGQVLGWSVYLLFAWVLTELVFPHRQSMGLSFSWGVKRQPWGKGCNLFLRVLSHNILLFFSSSFWIMTLKIQKTKVFWELWFNQLLAAIKTFCLN